MSLLDIFSGAQRRRRRKLCREPFPLQWRQILERNVSHYERLEEAERSGLHDAVRIFVAEKDWEGCGGLEMSDEIRVTIAGQACLLVFAWPQEYYFDEVRAIVVYPGAFVEDEDGVERDRIGEAVDSSTIVLSWEAASEGGASLREVCNVVFHEFAHILDFHTGESDGVPVPRDDPDRGRWEQTLGEEFDRLLLARERGESSVLDFYGLESHAELFAVTTEAFFQRPADLVEERRDLYGLLADFYRQDPARGQVRPGQSPREEMTDEEYEESLRGEVEEWTAAIAEHPRHRDAILWRADAYSELGELEKAEADIEKALELDGSDVSLLHQIETLQWEREDFAALAGTYDRILRIVPDDAEAHGNRGVCLTHLERLDEALIDFDCALRLDPKQAFVWMQRADVHHHRGADERAVSDATRAIELDPKLAAAHEIRASAHAELGRAELAAADRARADELDASEDHHEHEPRREPGDAS